MSLTICGKKCFLPPLHTCCGGWKKSDEENITFKCLSKHHILRNGHLSMNISRNVLISESWQKAKKKGLKENSN